MEVRWTVSARRHLREIHAYIAADSEDAADRFVDRLEHAADRLAQFPDSGRAVPRANNERVREVIFENYRIVYTRFPDLVVIVAVRHGAMNL